MKSNCLTWLGSMPNDGIPNGLSRRMVGLLPIVLAWIVTMGRVDAQTHSEDMDVRPGYDQLSLVWGPTDILADTPHQQMSLWLNNPGSSSLPLWGIFLKCQIGGSFDTLDPDPFPHPVFTGADVSSKGHLFSGYTTWITTSYAPHILEMGGGYDTGKRALIRPGLNLFATIEIDTTGVTTLGQKFDVQRADVFWNSELSPADGMIPSEFDQWPMTTLTVVPEPSHAAYLFAGVAVTSLVWRRLQRQRHGKRSSESHGT
jgi:hypothetical protein